VNRSCRRPFQAVVALALALVATGTFAQVPAAHDYAITHAKLFTLAGPPLEDATLLIHDGKISAVGQSIAIPAGFEPIDAKGLEVYPGLFDPLTQMGLSEISAVGATVDTSEAGVFNPDVVAATAISPSSAHIPVTRAAGITEVLVAPASGGFGNSTGSNLIGGQASVISLYGWTAEDMLVRKSAAMVIDWPAIQLSSFDFSTFTQKETPYTEAKKAYDKQVDQLAAWIEQARHYSQITPDSPGPAFPRDLKLESLGPVVRGEMPVLILANQARDIRNAVEFCDHQKLKMILAGGSEASKVKDLLRSKGIPVILGPTLAEPAEEDDAYDRLMTQPAELSEAGVKFAFASFDNSFARRLGQQAANAVAHGLPWEEGLKAVTLYPAQILGLDPQLGTIETGKIANLIVTSGDPLEVTTEIRYLFIKGQRIPLENRHKDLYEKYSNRPKSTK
jgi:imidazolonepropionase-like amidohydrolase